MGSASSRWVAVLLLILVFLLGVVLGYANMVRSQADPDMFWHLKTGQLIAKDRAVPRTDTLSWLGQERELKWTPHSWLFDLGAYEIFSAGGFLAVYLVTSVLFGLLGVAVAALTWVRTEHLLASIAVGMLAVFGSLRSVAPRPQVLTFILLALVMLLLEKKRWYLALLLVILGVNVHGALYPVYLGLFAVYSLPKRPWEFAAAVVACLVQPFGFSLATYPLSSFAGEDVPLQEWRRTSLLQEPVLLLTVIGLALLVRWKRVDWRSGLIALGTFAVAMSAVRHIPLFFCLGVPALAPAFRGIPEKSADGESSDRPATRIRPAFIAIWAGVLCVLLVAVAARYWRAPDIDRTYPGGAAAYVRSHNITRVWNEWGEGGYLLFRGVPTLVDGRADPFLEYFNPKLDGFAEEYAQGALGRTDIRPLLRQLGIEYLIVGRDQRLYSLLDRASDFESVYSDDSHAVFRYER